MSGIPVLIGFPVNDVTGHLEVNFCFKIRAPEISDIQVRDSDYIYGRSMALELSLLLRL